MYNVFIYFLRERRGIYFYNWPDLDLPNKYVTDVTHILHAKAWISHIVTTQCLSIFKTFIFCFINGICDTLVENTVSDFLLITVRDQFETSIIDS